jgi:hypothetical protein
MRSGEGHAKAARRARRQRQRPAREGRESKSRGTAVQGTQDPPQSSLWDDEQRHARAMRQLRVWIKALSAILVAAAARALIDGVTVALALAVVLTGVLLVAALWLRRLGSSVVLASAAAARNQTSNAAPTSRHPDD